MFINFFLPGICLAIVAIVLIGIGVYIWHHCSDDQDLFAGTMLIVFGLILGYGVYDSLSSESQANWIMSHKPTCMDKTEECLEKRIDWYKDSIRVMTKSKKDERSKQRKLDSLQHVLNHFETHE